MSDCHHVYGGMEVRPCPGCRIETLEAMLSAANATHDLTLSVAKEAMDRIEEREATIARLNRRAQAAESALRHAEADAEQAIHYTEMERDSARAVARVLAHAWRHDSRPPDEVVRDAEGYPRDASEKKGAGNSVDSTEGDT